MRNFVTFLSVVAISSALNFSVPASAQRSDEIKGLVEYCSAFGNEETGPGKPNQGGCISAYTSGPLAFCKFLNESNMLEFFGFTSFSNCVSTLRRD